MPNDIAYVMICTVWEMLTSQIVQIKKSHQNLEKRAQYLTSLGSKDRQLVKSIYIAKQHAYHISNFVQTAIHLIMMLRKEYFKLYQENQELKQKLKYYEQPR